MNSFLITFKPATENPKRGWKLSNLQKLVARCRSGHQPIEPWRFHNRKDVFLDDRVFLLLQGKNGPAIIGYGKVVGIPEQQDGTWRVPVQFESLADPTVETFASKDELLAIESGLSIWRTQSSGVLLKESVASQLEFLVVGSSPKPRTEVTASNPGWTRDELILALDFYLKHRPSPPAKDSEEIRALSGTLKRLGQTIFPATGYAETFRNENGVYMKLMNFRRLDPEYTADGKRGLGRGAKADEEVWAAFAEDPLHCDDVAKAILAALDHSEARPSWAESFMDDGVQEAPEGRILTRMHVARERNRQLVESKRKQAMKKHGKLLCEVCGFDFAIHYAERGDGFIECHHTKPVAALVEGQKTHIDDLALVCANCHRMIHRSKRWLSISDLKAVITSARTRHPATN